MSGIKFEILVPTEAEERRLNGVTDDTLLIPQLVDNTSGVDIIITPVQQHTASVHTVSIYIKYILVGQYRFEKS